MKDDLNSTFTLSIDWEDFGQLAYRDHSAKVTEPLKTIDRQTGIILDILSQTKRKATFFILGMLAQYRPDLVKKIAKEGHEIALHGQHHKNMRNLSKADAYNDLRDSYKLITDIIGGPVYGYRAPYFSIDESNFYVLEMLADLGLIYDSSIFPIKLKRYGIENFNTKDTLYELPNGKSLVELPLTISQWNNKKIPVAGGGYMRLFPKFYLDRIFRDKNSKQQNVMLYLHPYEFDTQNLNCTDNYPPGENYSRAKTFLFNMRWNLFRNSITPKICSLLEDYNFITCLKKAENVKTNTYSPTILGCPQ
ncbi:polysaccharide deacetylase family protein, PEP-CTERM locus subfamily [Chitinophaga sp. CF118]|uniref:polysaccharide deacetylase family protein n=1 Tax=Chitinophaga sp. CF118 TaxID=1884367 RepID=UPI0008E3C548|nr:polysaccharide deacetylase family protein [Chitinophaga sp. CF118]SFD80373.1 polysaccharide deacetylase family protein, PEP-CTERM locus subfamily [Chitinophaga sp. CF118]